MSEMIKPETVRDLNLSIRAANKLFHQAQDLYAQSTPVTVEELQTYSSLFTMSEALHTIVMCVNGKLDKLSKELQSLAMQR